MSYFMGFGSAIVPKGCGFSLQNRGADFHLDPASPNRLEGGKRPFHTLSPAMMTQGEELVASFGVMGGFMRPHGHVQVLLLLHHRHHPQAALDAKRFCIGGVDWAHAKQFYNGTDAIELGTDPAAVARLRALGHRPKLVAGYKQVVFGKGHIIMRAVTGVPGRRIWATGADPRSDGCALLQL
ncbi:hypothetical protein Q5752_005752 [Cryptotrichosporon argae]